MSPFSHSHILTSSMKLVWGTRSVLALLKCFQLLRVSPFLFHCLSSFYRLALPLLFLSFVLYLSFVHYLLKVLINDGAIRMVAVSTDAIAGELRCRVLEGGKVTTGKGINLPESNISAPAITERDWDCVAWAVEH